MLLTLSTTHRPATDLGYLLHKHPDRVQEFRQSFGTARVFYPEANEERCTAALLLDVDPVRLARSRGRGAPDFSLGQYVNDRPYAASSLLATALAGVFSTARSGRCRSRPELADAAIPLEIAIPALPCRGGEPVARRLFEPLGWEVAAEPVPLDERFPEWGDSRYLGVRLTGTVRLADALNQLWVLLPVLDESKHYWQADDEVDKLLRAGDTWLVGHPAKELITKRYLGRSRGLAREALERLAELGDDPVEVVELDEPDPRTPLRVHRREAVLAALEESGARSVIDLGCGPGQLLTALVKRPFTKIGGTDVSVAALQQAARRLRVDEMGDRQRERIQLFQGALTYTDPRLAGYDAAVLMEVIEHLDPERLPALERVVFAEARPATVLVTTPNAEYNVHYEGLTGMRHHDHRFEWTRGQFEAWAERVAKTYGYTVAFRGIGDADERTGAPTQMGVFSRA